MALDQLKVLERRAQRGVDLFEDLGRRAAGRFVGSPIAMSAATASLRRPPPKLGEHTTEVLAEVAKDCR